VVTQYGRSATRTLQSVKRITSVPFHNVSKLDFEKPCRATTNDPWHFSPKKFLGDG
jgi:hypothetical protein